MNNVLSTTRLASPAASPRALNFEGLGTEATFKVKRVSRRVMLLVSLAVTPVSMFLLLANTQLVTSTSTPFPAKTPVHPLGDLRSLSATVTLIMALLFSSFGVAGPEKKNTVWNLHRVRNGTRRQIRPHVRHTYLKDGILHNFRLFDDCKSLRVHRNNHLMKT
jgi:hypothetical protein